jgi:hypothetical protein
VSRVKLGSEILRNVLLTTIEKILGRRWERRWTVVGVTMGAAVGGDATREQGCYLSREQGQRRRLAIHLRVAHERRTRLKEEEGRRRMRWEAEADGDRARGRRRMWWWGVVRSVLRATGRTIGWPYRKCVV